MGTKLYIICIVLQLQIIIANKMTIDQTFKDLTALARDKKSLLIFSTLKGGLIAIDSLSSEILWTIEDEPAIKAESEPNSLLPKFLPNPRDGSLYELDQMGSLKKLPFTIPQLVASAPCRSADGILYSGKKSDSWFLIDPKTGYREKVMGFMKNNEDDKLENIEIEKIQNFDSLSVYLGRTQYEVMMLDSLSKNKELKPWNITFYDYLSVVMAPDISNEYGYVHLTASSSGIVATLNKQGNLIWKKDFGSPIVSVFIMGKEGLLSVPFTTVADNVLRNIVNHLTVDNINEIQLSQSIYIGEHTHGYYVLPSLVDKDTARLSSRSNVKLLEGPKSEPDEISTKSIYVTDFSDNYILQQKVNTEYLEHKENSFSSSIQQIEGSQSNLMKPIEANCFVINQNNYRLPSNDIQKLFDDATVWFTINPKDHIAKLLLFVVILNLILILYGPNFLHKIRLFFKSKKFNSKTQIFENNIVKNITDLGNGNVQIGKIIFNPEQILGKGCEGTFVFRGTFDKRNVAVKRLLPECFSFADREVALLRESDMHENVVRYFCTEQDRQFRYIALELCAATLQDFTEGAKFNELFTSIDVWLILKQATTGLSHLHSLSIVHRDIKPQNVLLSFPDRNNVIRAMISDFGLCKKLNHENKSFSRRSGITGTEGWIAPEIILGKRATTAVDIFSLGCVFFYVLTKGYHAFGDMLRRQANILANEYDLTGLQNETYDNLLKSKMIFAEQLIDDMIQHEYKNRPFATAVCNHPLFWNEGKILGFLQDVSDRVEKLPLNEEPLKSLEKNGDLVINGDWNSHLELEIITDLKKYRGYMGFSIRDLLRALRNKKHHYNELSLEAQNILGNIPTEFTNYWLKKFPFLMQHVYHAFSYCSKESIFKSYYNQKYLFSKPKYFNEIENSSFELDNPKSFNVKVFHRKTNSKKFQKKRKIIQELTK